MELLEQRGYNDLSLAAIAERAGTTTATIYRRWGSKAELVMDAVFRTEGDDVVAETDDVAADLATMIRWSVEKICRPAALSAVAGMLGESRRERSARSAAAAMASRRVAERIERAQVTGQIRADADPMIVASMTAGPVMYAAFTGNAERIDDAWVDGLVALVLDGVRAGTGWIACGGCHALHAEPGREAMKQIRVHGPDDVRLDDLPEPEPGPGDALLRVAACGICGTDVSFVHMGGITGGPQCLGHEMAGVVEWVGADVTNRAVGDRVIVCPSDIGSGPIGSGAPEGGLTPLFLVRHADHPRRLFAVPDDMPLHVAALAEPLAVGMQSVNQADVVPGDKVAVFGCGPIGLMAITTLLDRGITDIVAVDLSAHRRELARGLGAPHALDPAAVDVWEELKRLHGTAPFMFGPTAATDAFIEASGSDRVLGEILQNGRFDGRMSVVGLHYQPVPTNYAVLLMKQFTIRGSFEYPRRFEDAIELLTRRDLSPLITHTLVLEDFAQGLAILEGSKDCGKVMITMGGDR